MQMLKYKVENVCSQIQTLSGHLENTSADIRMVKGVLEDAGTCHIQTQMLRNSLEGAGAEIQGLRKALEKANTLNSQTQDFLQSSSENTSFVLHMLSQDLEDANAEIQLLKVFEQGTAGQLDNWTMGMGTRRTVSILSRCGVTYNVMPPTSESARNPWIMMWPQCRAEMRGPSRWPALGLFRAACKP
nr:C-type lectin domain family 4 member F-like isoform X3 [Dasypus novemcinctus]